MNPKSNYYKENEKNIPRYIAIVVFLTIYVSNDTFFFGTNSIEFFVTLPRIMAIVLGVFLLTKQRDNVVVSRCLFPLILLVICYLLSCFYHHETITITGIYLVYIIFAYLFCTRIDFESFWIIVDKIMYVIAIGAIVIELFAYTVPALLELFPSITNIAGETIYVFGVGGIYKAFLHTLAIRSNGIFWEPGVFQVYLNLMIAIQLFGKERINPIRVMVYIIGVLITFSTAGYVVLLFLFLLYLLASKTDITKKVLIGSLLVSAIIALTVVNYTFIYDNVMSKLVEKNNYSATARYSSILCNIQLAFENPILGVGMAGMQNALFEKSLQNFGIVATANTNGILYPLAAYGIPFGFVYIFGMYKFSNLWSNSRLKGALFFIFVFLLFTGERLMSPLPYILMFYGFGYGKTRLIISIGSGDNRG